MAPVASKSIVVVDDDEGIRETLEQCLTLEGYRVQTASDGREGLELLRRTGPPGLLLLDLMMPGMDGVEVLKELSSDASLSGVPVVVFSAVSQQPGDLGTRFPSVCKLFAKPFDLTVLLDFVGGHFARTA